MDARTRRTIYGNLYKACDGPFGPNAFYEPGLINLVNANAEIARQKALYKNDAGRLAVMLMVQPVDSKTALGMFGLIFGSLPLLAVAVKIFIAAGAPGGGHLLWALLFTLAGMVTGLVGYALGRLVPGILSPVSEFRFANRIAAVLLIGFCWGAVAGAAGGFFLYLIGSIFGAVLGGLAGAVAVPTFVAFHSALRAGDHIERRHFLPIAFGITWPLCAYILGS